MDKGYFFRLCKYLLWSEKRKKKPRGMLPFSPSAVIFSADGSASMPSWSTSQKWKVISSICGHSTLRGSLVTVQKNFIYFQACSCLSEPPGVEWRRGGWGGAPQPQCCRQLTASCYALFRNSWSFLKCLLSFWKLDCSISSNSVVCCTPDICFLLMRCVSSGYWLLLFPQSFFIF